MVVGSVHWDLLGLLVFTGNWDFVGTVAWDWFGIGVGVVGTVDTYWDWC